MNAIPGQAQEWYNARPHPGPLPRGEGELFAVFLKNTRLDSPNNHSQNPNQPAVAPSPGGVGRGEGGRSTNFAQQVLP